jgi:hypothetical protein
MSDIPSDRLREDAEGVGSLSTCVVLNAGAHVQRRSYGWEYEQNDI